MNLDEFISAPVANEYDDDDDTYNSGDEFSLGTLDITSSEEINFDEIELIRTELIELNLRVLN